MIIHEQPHHIKTYIEPLQYNHINIISDLYHNMCGYDTLNSCAERQNELVLCIEDHKWFVCSSDMYDVTGFSTALSNQNCSTEEEEF